jgi:hypothetical protein
MRQKPRRAGTRWLQGAPAYVLDCFDDKGEGDRYTVFFGGEFFVCNDGFWHVQYLGMSDAPAHPQGVSMWGEMNQNQAAGYRYRHGKHRVRWLDLPENIRAHVTARAR